VAKQATENLETVIRLLACLRLPLNPLIAPAPVPSAVDPHTVERAWFLASRWSAPLYERL